VPQAGDSAVRVGCSGWNYDHWRHGVFYPERCPAARWLPYYAERFDTVEVNATFYRLPRPTSVARWLEQTPDGFVFAVKVSRYITHVKRLKELGPALERFLACLEPLLGHPKQGPYLWQLPPDFRRDDERLAAALAQSPPGRHAWEFRHESWFVPEVYELLRAHGAALVIAHHPERPFQTEELTAGWTFVRFHYGARGRRGNYSETELRDWAARVRGYRVPAYAYFNNDWEGFAIRNALRFRELVSAPPARGTGS
jgi:uncharacterized protein YecE (DUF72 family)